MIEVKDLNVSYYNNQVLKDVNFKIDFKNIVGIIGPNGAGKSTLIKAMLNFIKKDSGEVLINNKKLSEVSERIAYIPQNSELDLDFPISVLDVVLMGAYPRVKLFQKISKEDKQLALDALAKVEMLDYKNNSIRELSGGQRQKILIARALVLKADIYFLDEPFVGIDHRFEQEIIEILSKLRDEGKTIFIVHHDLSKVEQYFDKLILINKTIIKYGDTKDVFTYNLIEEVYKNQFNFNGLIKEQHYG